MNKAIMLLCALALARAAYPITATKAYVDGATNATLAAAKAYTDTVAGVTPTVVTNIAGRVTSNVVTKAYVEALGISGGGITTNDVNAIIASSNLCTVAAAQAMTNAVTEYVDDKFLLKKTYLQSAYSFSWSSDDVLSFISTEFGEPQNLVSFTPVGMFVKSWNHIKSGTFQEWQTLPSYLDSLDWRTTGNRTLANYGITDAYTKTQINGNAVTNGGAVASAKSYADATFLKGTKEGPFTTYFTTTEVPVFVNGISFNSQMKIYKKDDTYEPYFINDIFVFEGSDSGQGCKSSELKVDGSDVMTQNRGDNRYLRSYTETDPTATAKAQAAIAATLTGRTYDFANGSNFVKNVYTALTNVIQTLGGTVTNPPNFN